MAAAGEIVTPTAASKLPRPLAFALAALCLTAAAYYAGSALTSIWLHGWTEMFNDQFLQYRKLLDTSFPHSVLATDNDHRHVISHLARLLDLRVWHGDQDFGIALNILMLAVLGAVACAWLWRDPATGVATRAAATLAVALALYWRGSARMQFHGNEGFQIYLVMLCAFAAIHCVERLRTQPRKRWLVGALTAATIATFSFATGVAVFGLVLLLAIVRRVPRRHLLAIAGAIALALVLYVFVMPGGDAVRGSLALSPSRVMLNAARWLASFWTTGWLAFADAGVIGVDAARMRTLPLGTPLVASAQAVFALAGNPGLLGLAAAIGAGGVVVLLYQLWRAWREPDAVTRTEALGLGLSAFAAGVALLVALGRDWLFVAEPGEVLAGRYVVWTNLFWLGLALVFTARVAVRPLSTAAFATLVLAISIVWIPSHRANDGWAVAVAREIERRAAQIESDVYVTGLAAFGSAGSMRYLQPALDSLRANRVGMFRHQRSHLIGARPGLPPFVAAAAASRAPQPVLDEVTQQHAGWHVEGRLLDAMLRDRVDGLVVADASGRIVGIGEFSHIVTAARVARLDRIADGFDAYVGARAGCRGLILYGVDAAARSFVPLARIPDCMEADASADQG